MLWYNDLPDQSPQRLITCRQQPQLLMPIIQYVLPSKNKALKKLLHFYWEVCPKYDDSGKLKQEMILVVCALLYPFSQLYSADLFPSNAIRNDLVSTFVIEWVSWS